MTSSSPSGLSDIVTILEWHYPWYRYDIADIMQMKHIAMSICDINLTSRFWNWTNQTLMSSWHLRDNGRYLFSITHNNATFILWQLKNQSFRQLFFSCCYEKYVFFFKTALLYLKVISNIVSKSIYWGRRTKMSPN